MRIVIEADLLSRALSLTEYGDLLSLFSAGLEGHHCVDVSPEDSPDLTRWLSGLDERTKFLCETTRKRGFKERQRGRRFTIRVADVKTASWTDRRLPLNVAVKIAAQPLTLLLESGICEPAFLRVVSRMRRDFDIERLRSDRALDYRTYGGIDANWKWLDANAHDPAVASRHWVLCDSDARRPWKRPVAGLTSGELGHGARHSTECCRKHGVRLHVLARRFIESYLPLPAIQQWAAEHEPSRNPKFRALARLTPEQRHHYNMKNGFAQDRRDTEHAVKVGALYDDVAPGDLDVLEDGIAGNIADLFHEKGFAIPPHWLDTDGQKEEVDEIVDAILEMI